MTRRGAEPSWTKPAHSARQAVILVRRSVLRSALRIQRRRASSESTRKYDDRDERIDSKLASGEVNSSALTGSAGDREHQRRPGDAPRKHQMMASEVTTRKSRPSSRRPSQRRSWVLNGTELAKSVMYHLVA